MQPAIDDIVTAIYDSAADPAHWPVALERVRAALNAAFAIIGFADFGEFARTGVVKTTHIHTPWDAASVQQMIALINEVPEGQVAFANPIDDAFSQMSLVTEEQFKQTKIYKEWAGPNGLRDSIGGFYLTRDLVKGMFSAPSPKSRSLYNAEDILFLNRLLPHMRRAMMINDLVDTGNHMLALYRKVLDQIACPVFVVGPGKSLKFTNAAGDALLSQGDVLRTASGKLAAAVNNGVAKALDDALSRALTGDTALGFSGIGVPLAGISGARAACYVLPLGGKALRGELASGSAAVFVAARPERLPMVAEILRTLFDLTPMETRIAMAAAEGATPADLSQRLGTTQDTIRSHLKHVYGKLGVSDRTSMAAAIHDLTPPLVTP